VRDQVLENFHLSKHFQDLKIPTRALLGKGLIHMRMFPHGPGQLWTSWQKGFTKGAPQSHPRALLFSSIWLSGLMFTLTSLALLLTPFTNSTYLTLTGVAYLLGVIQCHYAFRLAGNFSFLNALLFPLTLLFYQTLFFTALIKKKRGLKSEWKGRSLD
jgi:4,4'-diaponeurosporenoate glycosyltransferase